MAVVCRAQGDGQTERTNRTLEEYLRFFVSPRQDNWVAHLANAEFAFNPAVNSSIKMSPFEAELGYCQEALEYVQAYMVDVYDKGRKVQEFKVGGRVYLSMKNLDTAHTGFPNSRELNPKWIGPYSVVRTVHKHAYDLNLPPGLKVHPVFNTGLLKPYEPPSRLSRPQDVILFDGSVGQLVEFVLQKRKRQGSWQYLIRWVGEEKPTWEPLANLHQMSGLIQEFEASKSKRSSKRRRATTPSANIRRSTSKRNRDHNPSREQH
ncbi:unnamed protein product [Phytophthora fragariaefolia]|uniref:Unnamed protein product n=1 Tax=Phytophthora fragariaefolia TaxID=1490495 RepID=A0A9W6XC46_9STRA|nr:unnamed protein product [Phytophthora fragariaefolia]